MNMVVVWRRWDLSDPVCTVRNFNEVCTVRVNVGVDDVVGELI